MIYIKRRAQLFPRPSPLSRGAVRTRVALGVFQVKPVAGLSENARGLRRNAGHGIASAIERVSDMPSILLVDDDVRLASMIVAYLREHQLDVTHAVDGASARATLQRRPFDLLILDLMLPDTDGLDLFRDLQSQPSLRSLPVIMLTARGDPMDRVVGLEIGAEDYIAKPFEPRELLARIRVVLRRGRGPAADILKFGRLEIDRGSRIVRVDGEEKTITSYQFDLLLAMAERAGRVLSRESLAELVRADHQPYDSSLDRSIDVHIARLRAALEDDPKQPRRILTVRGVGYVFAKAQS